MSNTKNGSVWTSKRPECSYVWALSPGGTTYLLRDDTTIKTPIIAYAEVLPPEIPEYLKPGARWTSLPPEVGFYWAERGCWYSRHIDRVEVINHPVKGLSVKFDGALYDISSYTKYCLDRLVETDKSSSSGGGAKQGAKP